MQFVQHGRSAVSTSAQNDMFVVSAALFTSLSHPSYHRSIPSKKSVAVVTAVDFAGHMKKHWRHFVDKNGLVSYKLFRFPSSAFPKYRRFAGGMIGPGRRERSMVAATHIGNKETVRELRSEHRLYYLLEEPVLKLSQMGKLIVDLFFGGAVFHSAAPPDI